VNWGMPSNVRTRGFDQLTAKAQQGLLVGLRAASKKFEQAIKDEAPVAAGDLRSAISVGPIIPYGPHRFQVRVIADLNKAPHYYYVIRGAKETEITPKDKKALKFLFGGSVFYRGKVVIPRRPPNNFPKRAVRRVGPEVTGLIARNFITRVAQ